MLLLPHTSGTSEDLLYLGFFSKLLTCNTTAGTVWEVTYQIKLPVTVERSNGNLTECIAPVFSLNYATIPLVQKVQVRLELSL